MTDNETSPYLYCMTTPLQNPKRNTRAARLVGHFIFWSFAVFAVGAGLLANLWLWKKFVLLLIGDCTCP